MLAIFFTRIFDIIQTHLLLLLLLLLLSRFSRVRPCATPETAAHQAPPSLGFSRQEHWRGLPFPSPMHESEKWKGSLSRIRLLATPWTAAYQAPLSMGFSRQEYWCGMPLTHLWDNYFKVFFSFFFLRVTERTFSYSPWKIIAVEVE